MPNRKRRHASLWIIFSALCLTALAALGITFWGSTAASESVVACPRGQPPEPLDEIAVQEPDQQEGSTTTAFAVDWEFWQNVNPDVIAWVRVPDTAIDCAIVQAPASDPDFYLDHDIYRNWNPYGCAYVDATCTGITNQNTVIYGHNMGFSDAMFADFARYSDEAFALTHPTVIVQTPAETLELKVSAAAVIDGSETTLRTEFTDRNDLASWYDKRIEEAGTRITEGTGASRVFTFITCSYNRLSNERTLVYAQPQLERIEL